MGPFLPTLLGWFCHGPCYDFTQHQTELSYDSAIPRASTNSAANSGTSTPSLHTDIGDAPHTQTNGNSVGRTLAPDASPLFTPHFASSLLIPFLQMLFYSLASAHLVLSALAVSIATSSTGCLWITSLSGFFFHLVELTIHLSWPCTLFVQYAGWTECTPYFFSTIFLS